MKGKSFNDRFEMKKKFDHVLKMDFNGSSIGQVQRSINGALGPLPYINWPMDNTWSVIRARYIDETLEDITDLKAFGAPPPVETSQGRANLVNHPVFYGTFDSRTAMQELNVPLDSQCYVSIWEFKNDTPKLTTFLSGVDEKNDLFGVNNLIPKGVPTGLKGGYTRRSLEYALKLRAGAFVSSNYSFTSKIAHNVIYNNVALSNGLLYPSVVDPYRCNVALHPEFVATNMECVRIYKMIWSGAFIFRVLSRGSIKNEKVVWEDVGSYEDDDIDRKYQGGGNGPNEIHPSALEVLKQKNGS